MAATPLLPDALKKAHEYARSMIVHRRQCVHVCTSVEKALSAGSPLESGPESGQQWDDALANIHDHLAEWSKLDIVQSFLHSDQINIGIEQLCGELRWCGIRSEDLQLNEKRRQDEAVLKDTLRTIASSQELFERVIMHPSDRIRIFVKRLQSALREGSDTNSVREKLELALMFLYKNADVRISTPDLTSQITDIDSTFGASNPLYQTYRADWLNEERVTVRALKLVRYDAATLKRFRRKVAAYYSIRHPNIVRVYGLILNQALGCCLVLPMLTNANALAYLEHRGDTHIVSWLHDVATGLQYMHSSVSPVLCGCLRAENILVRDDGTGVCISDFGLPQLTIQLSDAVESLLRWCAPEVIRAANKKVHGEEPISIFTKHTDIYSFGIIMFELFTSEVPFYHIQDNETLEIEILHGARPSMSGELNARASRRGFSTELHALMKGCWDSDPRKRPSADDLVGAVKSCTDRESQAKPEILAHRPESSSSSSVMSGMSLSTNSSVLHPMTPRSSGSMLSDNPVTVFTQAGSPESPGRRHFDSGQIFTEPAPIELDRRHVAGQMSIEILRKMSAVSVVHSQQNESEHTICQELGSSFSSDKSDESHLGQRENSAYERMPKLKAPSLMSKRRGSKDRFEILVSRMTIDGQVNPNWVGVASMEGLRGITRRSSKLTQATAVESLIKRETQFLSDAIDEYLAERLRADPGILGTARLEGFLSRVFEDSHTLRLVNHHFRNALQVSSNVSAIGFTRMALLCKEAAAQFCMVYPEYVRHLPEVQKYVMDEVDSNDRFSAIMEETQSDGRTLLQALNNFLCAPVTHLDQHPRTLQLIITEMSAGDPELPVLQEAYLEVSQAVNLVHLSSWQQSTDKKDWKDFVTIEVIKRSPKAEVSRQTSIFELIAEERDYVGRLKILQKILHTIFWELVNLHRKEDTTLQNIIKALIAVFGDLLRFHYQLLENLYTLQRSQHPSIGTFVTTCGCDQIPFYTLYEHHFGSSYRKLVTMMQEGKVRSGIFKRIMQQHPTLKDDTDFMTLLRAPSLHLRAFVGCLRTISELTPEGGEDQLTISEIFPRFWNISQQVELKTAASKERARLSSLAAALDFSSFAGIEKDIDIASSSRTLVMSGNMRLGVGNPNSTRVSVEDRFALLLDNYLLFTRKIDSQGILRLHVCERPLPLELLRLSSDDVPPTATAPSDTLFPCMKVHYGGLAPIYLYGETEYTSRVWRSKLQESQTLRAAEAEKSMVIEMEVLQRFAKPLSCSAEFSYAGQDILALACETPAAGIWIRQGREPLRHAVALKSVTCLTVLNDLAILLVLAERSLLWYRLEDLMRGNRVSQRNVDESMAVYFYRTGIVSNRIFLVVSAKKKGKNILRFFEAAEGGRSSKVLNAFKNKNGPFSPVTEVELTSYVKDVYFLRTSFVLVTDTFQLVNFVDAQQLKDSLTSAKPRVLPLSEDPLTDVVKRCRSSTPLAIYRIDKDFILCYRDFASYVNVNGQLSPRVVEWESKDVETIIFRPPYMLVLGATTLEIRQIATGKLEQLLAAPGNVQLSWERRHEENSASDLGIHLLMGVGPDSGPSNQWYTLDNHLPHALFRLRRHDH